MFGESFILWGVGPGLGVLVVGPSLVGNHIQVHVWGLPCEQTKWLTDRSDWKQYLPRTLLAGKSLMVCLLIRSIYTSFTSQRTTKYFYSVYWLFHYYHCFLYWFSYQNSVQFLFLFSKFLWGHWHSCFGLLVRSPLGFKATVSSLIHPWHRCMCYTFPRLTSGATPSLSLPCEQALVYNFSF